MKTVGIIPARYGSTRFPAKALADIAGKSMVRRVYEQCAKSSLDALYVATDHEKIYQHVKDFGGKVIMTSDKHPSGTDRCAEAVLQIPRDFSHVINIQGDEPYIRPEQINLLADGLKQGTEIATLVKRIEDEKTLFSQDVPKVIFNKNSEAIYFSRQTIPLQRNQEKADWLRCHTYYKHIGIYAYRKDVLKEITGLEPSDLEQAEALEQLRWLENGYRIKVIETEYDSHGIDRPEDVHVAVERFGSLS